MGRIFLVSVALGGMIAAGSEVWAGGEIQRVKIEEYLAAKPARTEDLMIRFERSYLSWGAITQEEYREREGKYYTVFWKVKDSVRGATLRFEYLQAQTATTVHVQEVAVTPARRGSNSTDFRVTGSDYRGNGDVLAWKITLLADGAVLAESKSFLWKDL